MNFRETPNPIRHGHFRVFEQDNPSNILYENHNVVCNTSGYLFARLMANITEPQFGIWGLALGDGDPAWPANNQPDALPTQTTLIAERLRKPLSAAKFVDANLTQVERSSMVDFQTIINATTDNLITPIREMGYIGGGHITRDINGNPTAYTDMMVAPYFNPLTPEVVNSVVLINYKALPSLLLPAGVSFIFSTIFTF